MQLTVEELNMIRQWFNAVEDMSPEYLEYADRELGKRITEYLNQQTRDSERS